MPYVHGKTFDEFNVGDSLVTTSRTLTQADITNFAQLSGDRNPIHTDADYGEKSDFGRNIAHGLLIQSIASGLAVQTGFLDGTLIAFRSLSAKFSLPVFIDDTIYVKLEVTAKKKNRRINGGNIMLRYSVLNQEDKTVQRGEWTVIVANSKAPAH